MIGFRIASFIHGVVYSYWTLYDNRAGSNDVQGLGAAYCGRKFKQPPSFLQVRLGLIGPLEGKLMAFVASIKAVPVYVLDYLEVCTEAQDVGTRLSANKSQLQRVTETVSVGRGSHRPDTAGFMLMPAVLAVGEQGGR